MGSEGQVVLCVGDCGCIEYWACTTVMLYGLSTTVVQGGAIILVAELVAEELVRQHVDDSVSTHAQSLSITDWLSMLNGFKVDKLLVLWSQLIQFIVQGRRWVGSGCSLL